MMIGKICLKYDDIKIFSERYRLIKALNLARDNNLSNKSAAYIFGVSARKFNKLCKKYNIL